MAQQIKLAEHLHGSENLEHQIEIAEYNRLISRNKIFGRIFYGVFAVAWLFMYYSITQQHEGAALYLEETLPFGAWLVGQLFLIGGGYFFLAATDHISPKPSGLTMATLGQIIYSALIGYMAFARIPVPGTEAFIPYSGAIAYLMLSFVMIIISLSFTDSQRVQVLQQKFVLDAVEQRARQAPSPQVTNQDIGQAA